MQPEAAPRRARWSGLIGLILLIAATAIIWWGLDQLGPRADWLQVEAPRHAVAGQPLTLRVPVGPLPEATYLCADLHWAATRDSSKGYLATGGTKPVGKAGGTFEFEITLPPRNGMRFVNGIIFLSRTGDWRDHTRTAAT